MEPLGYVIDPDQRLITITGEYADAEAWRVLFSRMFHDPRREAGFSILGDLRDATKPMDATTVDGIVDAVRGFWPYLQPCRGAILTSEESEPARSAVDVLAHRHHLPVRIFRSYDVAMEWLHQQT
jgi:hypothetical protein